MQLAEAAIRTKKAGFDARRLDLPLRVARDRLNDGVADSICASRSNRRPRIRFQGYTLDRLK